MDPEKKQQQGCRAHILTGEEVADGLHRSGQVVFNRPHRNTHPTGNLLMGQSLESAQPEYIASSGRQRIDGVVVEMFQLTVVQMFIWAWRNGG